MIAKKTTKIQTKEPIVLTPEQNAQLKKEAEKAVAELRELEDKLSLEMFKKKYNNLTYNEMITIHKRIDSIGKDQEKIINEFENLVKCAKEYKENPKNYKIVDSLQMGRFYLIEIETNDKIRGIGISRRAQGDKMIPQKGYGIALSRALKAVEYKRKNKHMHNVLMG